MPILTLLHSNIPIGAADWFAQEKPQRIVSLPGYWIYRYPVTVAQFRACCRCDRMAMPAAPEWGWQDDHPMVNVNWQDVIHYADWAQAMIPTEAQWEKAARGTDGTHLAVGEYLDAGLLQPCRECDHATGRIASRQYQSRMVSATWSAMCGSGVRLSVGRL